MTWYLIRPLAFDSHGGIALGYLLDAESEQDARREAGQYWGFIESCIVDEPPDETVSKRKRR